LNNFKETKIKKISFMINLTRCAYRIKMFLNFRNVFYSLLVFFYSLIGQNTRYPKYLLKFESEIAKFFNSKYALTFSNGTTALNAILYSLGVGKKSKVLISKLSFPSVISSILRMGATPVYLDFDKDLQIILADKEKIISSEFLLITHIYGIPQNISLIKKFFEINPKLVLIEDISHAQGAKIEKKFAGTVGRASFMSMQGDKSIGAGEGGIAFTSDEKIYNKMIYLMHLNRPNKNNPKLNLLSKVGFLGKGRMSPIGAVWASRDLKTLKKRNIILREKFKIIYDALNNFKDLNFPSINNFEDLGGFYYGFPVFIKSNKILGLLKKYFYINKYNWPHLDKSEKFNDPEKFMGLIYGSDPNIDEVFAASNDLRDDLYFFDLSNLIYMNNFRIKKNIFKFKILINET
jgi:dTDP-4-amino-4,6-dideoxygalactose transaminase